MKAGKIAMKLFSQNGGLFSINLSTFKCSSLDYFPKIGAYCQACKLDSQNYLFHGGRMDNSDGAFRGETYILNTIEKTYKVMKKGPCADAAGLVKKDNQIYLFLGYNGGPLNTNYSFNMETNEWKLIQNLPQAAYHVTAALLNNNIVFTGNQLSCLYMYDDSSFSNILPLPSHINKIVYENREKNYQNWINHNINIGWNNVLYVFTTFRKNQYIYFIDVSNQLFRIDTSAKKLEIVSYN